MARSGLTVPGVRVPIGGTAGLSLAVAGDAATAPVVTTLVAPTGLGYTPPFTITRSVASDGTVTYSHDYDPASTMPVPTHTVYVDVGATDNAGDGLTWATRVRSLAKGIAIANTLGTSANATAGATVVDMRVRPGTYRYRNKDGASLPDNLNGTQWTRDLIVRPCDATGAPLANSDRTSRIRSIHEEAITGWGVTSDPNIYVASYVSASQYPGRCLWDEKFADPDYPTYPTDLRAVGQDSLGVVADRANPWPEINALWTKYGRGACYLDETNKKLYVRTKDNRAPDSQIIVSRGNSGSNQGRHLYMAPGAGRNLRLWAANLDVLGGSGLRTFLFSGNAGAKQTIYTKDCAFGFADDDTVHLDGPGFGIQLRPLALGAWKDGFNYQQASLQDSGSVFIELDAKADWCGNSKPSGDASNNASSAHNACKLVRVNCAFRRSADRQVHDIMDVKSWNVGVACANHRRAGTDPTTAPGKACANFVSGYDSLTAGTAQAAEMWLDGCTSAGANFDLSTQASGAAGGKLHLRNMRSGLTQDTSTGGTIDTY